MGVEMKQLLQNRMLMVGLGVSLLFHAVLLLAKIDFPSAYRNEPPQMELRFVLRDRLPVVPVSVPAESLEVNDVPSEEVGGDADASGTASGQAISSVQTADSGRGGAAGRQVVSSPGPSTSDESGSVAASEYSGYSGASEDAGDVRSVVFRRDASSHGGTGSGRVVITAATREPAYAMYYRSLRRRIEQMGMINFPQRNGARLYGELTVRIPVYRDGSISAADGGVSIERSSGNPDLDSASKNIVRRAAPFGPFPRNAQSTADVWVIITRLKFTRDLGSLPQVRSIQ